MKIHSVYAKFTLQNCSIYLHKVIVSSIKHINVFRRIYLTSKDTVIQMLKYYSKYY